MRDLKPGDNLVLTYDTIDGVNVLNRVATGTASADSNAATAQSPSH